MTTPPNAADADPSKTKSIAFGGFGLIIAIIAVLLALIATPLAAALESKDWLFYAMSLWSSEIAETRSYLWLQLCFGGLGLLAIVLALIETHLRRMNWTARFALLLGVMALAWKWVIWAFAAAIVISVLASIS